MSCDRENIHYRKAIIVCHAIERIYNNRKAIILYFVLERIFITEKLLYYIV